MKTRWSSVPRRRRVLGAGVSAAAFLASCGVARETRRPCGLFLLTSLADARWPCASAGIGNVEIVHAVQYVARLRVRIGSALRTGDLFSEEYRLVDADGNVSWLLAEGRCELDAAGEPLRFPGVSFGIGARKAVEQRLRELEAELERADEALRQHVRAQGA
jgi:PAS domain-containing protein